MWCVIHKIYSTYVTYDTCMYIYVSMYTQTNTHIHMYVCTYVCVSARNKDQKLVGRFLKVGYFIGQYLHCCPIENVWKIWPIKIDFGWPYAGIDRKMANG